MDEAVTDVVIELTANDEVWRINLTRDLKGSDWLAMERHRPDLSYASVINAILTKQVTVLALVLWAVRRKDGEADLTYTDVLDSIDAASVGEPELNGGTQASKPDTKGKKGKKGDEPRPS